MGRGIFIFALIAAASAPALASERFDDSGGCLLHLQHIVADARGAGFEAAEGPYPIGPSDVRAHTVRAEGLGHRISEYRCADGALSSRSWLERLDNSADGAFSIESLARAEWLE